MADSYRDQVRIEIHQVGAIPASPAIESTEIVISRGGLVDLDWIHDQLENAFHDETTGLLRYSYRLSEQRREVHWGAAGAQALFVVETAAEVGVDTLLGLAVTKMVTVLRTKYREVSYGKMQVLSESEIEQYGRRAIEVQYSVPISSLQTKSVGAVDNSRYSVTAIGPNETQYSIVFSVHGGITEVHARNREHQ